MMDLIKKQKILERITNFFSHECSYDEALRTAKRFIGELNLLKNVNEASLLPFELHFELRGRKEPKLIQVDEFVKKLFGFGWHNREETGMYDESQIAHLLFLEITKRHPTLDAVMESKKQTLQIAND